MPRFSEAEITNMWERFYLKNNIAPAPTLYSPIEEGKDEMREKIISSSTSSSSTTSSLQRMPVVVSADDLELNRFVRGQKIEQSTNTAWLNALYGRIFRGEVTREDIMHSELPYLAMALYTAKKISLQQCGTLLEQSQTCLDFGFQAMIPILDSQDQLTEAARTILSVHEQASFKMGISTLDAEEEANFCQLVAALPFSERYIYQYSYKSLSGVGETLEKNGLIFISGPPDNQLFVLSMGAQDALGIARFGVTHYVCTMACLGFHTTRDVEAAVNAGYRPGPLYYPGTDPFPGKKVHDAVMSYHEARKHDEYHSLIYSKTPLCIREANHFLRERIKSAFQVEMSNELWCSIDFDNVAMRTISPQILADIDQSDKDLEVAKMKATFVFCRALNEVLFVAKKESYYASAGGYYIMKDGSLSAVGAVLFLELLLDYHAHPDNRNLERFLIKPEYLLEPFKKYYDTLLQYWPEIQSTNRAKMIFKCQMCFALKSAGLEDHFGFWSELVDKREANLPIRFGKINATETTIKKRYTNTLSTVLFGKKLTENRDLLAANTQLLEQWGEQAAWLKRITKSNFCCRFFRCFTSRPPVGQPLKALPEAARAADDAPAVSSVLFVRRPAAEQRYATSTVAPAPPGH